MAELIPTSRETAKPESACRPLLLAKPRNLNPPAGPPPSPAAVAVANRWRAQSSVGAMRPFIVLIAMFAALAAVAANASAIRLAKPCGAYSVRAVVGGRATCLRDEQPCRHRFERRYQRYGFHCRSEGSLVATWRRLGRPLRVPTVATGAPCPVSNPETRFDFPAAYGVSRGIGPGPVYPVNYRPRGPDMSLVLIPFPPLPGYFTEGSEWNGWKHVWVVRAAYQGPVLIRGGQLDGANDVRFGGNIVPPSEHRLPAAPRQLAGRFRFERTFSRVRATGCYAYQIDGTTFSYLVVFEVRAA